MFVKYNAIVSKNFEKYIFCVILLLGVCAGMFITSDNCPPNEEYLLCGSACPFNCSNPEGPAVCSEDCVEGCFCKAGYLRDEIGACVPADQCFVKDAICKPNEEFLSCGSACSRTCKQPEPLVCGLACSMGCFCKAGFVRDPVTDNCVTLENCLFDQCLIKNEVYSTCNASCEPTCEDPLPICSQICTGGCVCAPGLLRDVTGECVSANKCGNFTDAIAAIRKILHL